jgi:hypothetical protein
MVGTHSVGLDDVVLSDGLFLEVEGGVVVLLLFFGHFYILLQFVVEHGCDDLLVENFLILHLLGELGLPLQVDLVALSLFHRLLPSLFFLKSDLIEGR